MKTLNVEENEKMDELNRIYKEECTRQFKEGILHEVTSMLDSEEISNKTKEWTVGMIYGLVMQAKKTK